MANQKDGETDFFNSPVRELEMPTFTPDVPEDLLSQMDEPRKWMARQLSVLNQKTNWLAERSAWTHRMAVQDHLYLKHFREKYETPVKWIFGWLGKTAAVVIPIGVWQLVKKYVFHDNSPTNFELDK